MLNGEVVDALSLIVHADKAYERGRKIAEKLKEHIPRQLFEIPIQAAIGGKVIARETVKAMRKDVLANVTAVTSPVKRNCWKNRRKAKRKCASWVLWKFQAKHLQLFSNWTKIYKRLPKGVSFLLIIREFFIFSIVNILIKIYNKSTTTR